jgi:RNA polymerase-binding transcription factor DksA
MKAVRMNHLTEAQLREIQALLDRREAELTAEVREPKQAAAERLDTAGRDVKDAADDADERVLTGLDHVQLQRDQEELRDIEDARERLRHGRYGLCEVCGQPIPFERLRANPTAKFCLVHQAEWERRHPAAPPFTA